MALFIGPLVQLVSGRVDSSDARGKAENVGRKPRSASYNLNLLHSRFLEKLERGESTAVAVLGGSISSGSGLGRGQKTYASMFVDWLNEAFPVSNNGSMHVLWNSAQLGSGSDLASLCMRHFFHEDMDARGGLSPDVLLLDFAVNDERNQAPPFRIDLDTVFTTIRTDPPVNVEQIIRQALEWKTPVMMLEFPALRNLKFGVLIPEEWHKGAAIHGAGSQHLVVAEAYGVPYVDVAGEYLSWATPLTLPLFFKDHLHPREVGHAFIAYQLVKAIRRQQGLRSSMRKASSLPRERTRSEAWSHINKLPRAASRPYADVYPWDGLERVQDTRGRPLTYETARGERLFPHPEPESKAWNCSLATIRDREGNMLHSVKPVRSRDWTYDEDPVKSGKWGYKSERIGAQISFELDPKAKDVAIVFLKSSAPIGAAVAWISAGENDDWVPRQAVLLDGTWHAHSKQLAVEVLPSRRRTSRRLFLHVVTIDPDHEAYRGALLSMGKRSAFFKVVGYLTSTI